MPVERCQRLIADVTGAQVSAGFVHSCLARAAGLIADVVRLIRTLITAAHVAGFDETTLRCGPAGQKRYVLAAVTERYSLFFLGGRALESFRDFGILPAFGGVVVSDRYANYFHSGWEHIAGNQACLAHLIRDYQDAAECYPAAIWPVQAQRALRDLIRGWHAARDDGQPEIPPRIRDPLLREFRHVVLAGLSDVPRVPGPKSSTAQHPGRDLLEFCRDRQEDVTRFCSDTRIWPTNNISERGVRPVKTQQKISAGSPARTSPRTGWTSAATSTPPASTGATSWTSCELSRAARHGARQSRRPPDHNERQSPSANGVNVYSGACPRCTRPPIPSLPTVTCPASCSSRSTAREVTRPGARPTAAAGARRPGEGRR